MGGTCTVVWPAVGMSESSSGTIGIAPMKLIPYEMPYRTTHAISEGRKNRRTRRNDSPIASKPRNPMAGSISTCTVASCASSPGVNLCR